MSIEVEVGAVAAIIYKSEPLFPILVSQLMHVCHVAGIVLLPRAEEKTNTGSDSHKHG